MRPHLTEGGRHDYSKELPHETEEPDASTRESPVVGCRPGERDRLRSLGVLGRRSGRGIVSHVCIVSPRFAVAANDQPFAVSGAPITGRDTSAAPCQLPRRYLSWDRWAPRG